MKTKAELMRNTRANRKKEGLVELRLWLTPMQKEQILQILMGLVKEENPCALWAEIYRLRAEIVGPENYKTWKDAAIASRVMLSSAEEKLISYAVVLGEISKSLPAEDPIFEEIVRLGLNRDV